MKVFQTQTKPQSFSLKINFIPLTLSNIYGNFSFYISVTIFFLAVAIAHYNSWISISDCKDLNYFVDLKNDYHEILYICALIKNSNIVLQLFITCTNFVFLKGYCQAHLFSRKRTQFLEIDNISLNFQSWKRLYNHKCLFVCSFVCPSSKWNLF